MMRDPKTLLLLFGMPVVQILLFGFALTNEIKNNTISISNGHSDPSTLAITNKFIASPYFDVVDTYTSTEEIEEAFKRGQIKVAIIFPTNFETDLKSKGSAEIQLLADASDPNTANTIINYASNIIASYQKELLVGIDIPYQININNRMIYNPELRGATNFVPGVMALVLLLICVLMTSVSIVKEKENGTMEVLLVSPFNPILVVLAKALPYFMLSIVNLIIILLLSVFVLDMPIHGSIPLLFLISSIFIITALSLGLLISTITASQQAAMLISLMGMLLPTMIFTGFMFPIENMPLPLQIFSNIIPSKWYYIIIKDIMIKGLGIAAIWKETLILLGMTIGLLTLSIAKFNRRMS